MEDKLAALNKELEESKKAAKGAYASRILRNLPGIAAASRWSVMFHEILHNVEELPQWSRGALPYSMFSAHQHPGPLAHYRIHPSFSSRLFSTILLRCTIVFCFGKCRAFFFMNTGCSMN